MPPYQMIHYEYLLWALVVPILFTVAIVLARASRHWSFTFNARSDKQLEEETHEFPGGVSEQNRPVPLFIWLVAIGLLVWAAGYVIFSGSVGLQ